MKLNFFRTAMLTSVASAMISFSALAAVEITSVDIKAIPSSEEVTAGTCVSPDFYSDSTAYSLSWDDISSSDSDNPKKERTYEIRLSANSGYTFPKETSVTVNVSGVNSITKKDTEDESSFIIRVKAYPYYQWPEVEDIEESETKIKWDKGDASKWEYVLEYENTSGDEKSKHGTTTNNYINVSSYNKEYTGSNEDKQDASVTAFSVRAIGNAGSNTNVLDGVWSGDADYSDYEDSYSTWQDAFGDSASGSTQTSGSTDTTSSTSSTLPSYVVTGTWSCDSAGRWSFVDVSGHQYRGEWAAVDNSMYANTAAGQPLFQWFYFDTNGYMYTGWYEDPSNGYRYYLQESSDGQRGRMVTGTYTIDGVTYNFSDVSDGYRGHLIQ
ncbi:MAG: hypothetical protein LIO81_01590 [Clostridiales bacterium]|nr:hypothetical protein [Clostridiales bacterium]